MGEEFSYHPDGNMLLQFPNFGEWINFCRLCVEKNIPAVKDTETMSAMISPQEFERLPRNLRDDFKVQDPETTKRMLGDKKSAHVKRPAARDANQHQTDEKKFIDLLLPPALMPRVE